MTLVVTGLGAEHHGVAVLSDIDFTVADRALACVIGPSGCGKTTLLRVIGGFHPPAAGRIELDDLVLDHGAAVRVAPERRRIGYIPQDGALFPHLTVAGNIGFGLPRSRRRRTVAELLELTDLAGLSGRYPHQLSGGQQQRVAIARALAARPRLLLLDEPFSALDAGLRAQVRNDVVDLLRSTGTAAVLVTHDPAEALSVADQITIMQAGRIVQTGTPDELHSRPVSVTAARALGDANVVAAKAAGRTAATVLGDVSLTAAVSTARISVSIRPTQVVVEPGHLSVGVPGEIRRVEFRGENYRFEVAVPGMSALLIAYGPARLAARSAVRVRIEGAVHPFLE